MREQFLLSVQCVDFAHLKLETIFRYMLPR